MMQENENNEGTTPMIVLAIDDEDSCRFGLELMLLGLPYRLVCKENAEEGLKYLRNHVGKEGQADIVLLDLMMPDMYGLDMLKIVREHPELASIPVVLQTGAANQADIIQAKELGANGYLTKPYDKPALLRAIAEGMGGSAEFFSKKVG